MSAPGRNMLAGRYVLQFVLSSLAALVALGVAGFFVARSIGDRQALREARETAGVSAHGIIEQALDDGVLTGDPASLERLDEAVEAGVLLGRDRVARVKIWTRGGRLVYYSDFPEMIGVRFPMEPDKLESFATGRTVAERSDLADEENRLERPIGQSLYEVYLPVRTSGPKAEQLLYEEYQFASAVRAGSRRLWLAFTPIVGGALLALWLVQVPLARRLVGRLRESQRGREALLTQSIEASSNERRRIAADLHDGVVQNLAGLSYQLAAAADRAPGSSGNAPADALRDGAASLRASIRELRSVIVDLHPPNLASAGLAASISDLAAPLSEAGMLVRVDVPDGLRVDDDRRALLYRAAREALRNVARHSGASAVNVAISSGDGMVSLQVSDDGCGFSREDLERRRAEGHLGLSLLEQLAEQLGGNVSLESSSGAGTRFRMEVPTG